MILDLIVSVPDHLIIAYRFTLYLFPRLSVVVFVVVVVVVLYECFFFVVVVFFCCCFFCFVLFFLWGWGGVAL